jgi:predicted alpha/beta-hydrolase family hydrolase
MPKLQQRFHDIISATADRPLIVGGKSMGGRVASMLADSAGVDGVVCLGYPFHPPKKPDRLRTQHLETLRTPTLIIQGERDPFGNRQEVEAYPLSPAIRVRWMTDGDHGLKPRKRSGETLSGHLDRAGEWVLEFLSTLPLQRRDDKTTDPGGC